jgi:hypothetical protein
MEAPEMPVMPEVEAPKKKTNVWMMSLIWLIAGTLSAKNSTTARMRINPMIHQLVKVSQGWESFIRLVNFARSAIASNGIYAFKPALAESPNAEKIPSISILTSLELEAGPCSGKGIP